ncbi:YiiD C-terminal domain-containing protein, partial [Pseudomonas sp. GW460-C8]|uniref:YiiD C-terminal domain-containing protein n=1 Tax=Pseudomonas sp. GW460-C8 TaxID=2070589 RepID=UPI000CBC4AF8
LEPITQDFTFICRGADLDEFFVNFDRRGVARIELESHAIIDGRVMSRVAGSFVAKRSRKPI